MIAEIYHAYHVNTFMHESVQDTYDSCGEPTEKEEDIGI